MKTTIDILKFITGGVFNILVSIILIAVIYTISIRAFDYGKGLLVEDKTSVVPEEIVLTIPDGSDTAAVAELLEDEGLIGNKWFFYFQARVGGSYKYFLSGDFLLNKAMSTNEIMEALQSTRYVTVNDLSIVIPEGLTNKQIAALVEAEGFFTAKEFLEACETLELDYDFLPDVSRDNRLEGYLFPDTYYLPPNPEPADLIIRMLNRFGEIYDFSNVLRADELGFSIDDVVIMASIIEKEIKVADERALASSVIYNRLKINMPLQMCSTILYALDKRKDRLFDEDLQVKSPYNTYINNGLPVGPICNPGAAAIDAALYPEQTNYIYFVVKDEETGEHFFTASNDEFIRAKAQYNQKY